MITNALNELSSNFDGIKFTRDEMKDHYLKEPNENFAYNLHWRIYNYAQIKFRTSKIAQKQNKNPEQLYSVLIDKFKIDKNHKYPENFDKLLKKERIPTNTPIKNGKIGEICQKYFPKVDKDKITAPGENTFEDIINTMSKENGVCLGFAHPYFLIRYLNNPETAIKNFIKKSNGLIKTTESYHQAYKSNINFSDISSTNKIIEKHGLLPLGGQDNHTSTIVFV
ncbi:MAG: hypothetical protein PHV68_04845 [Candidatus Gastranaerophilales bacterium]|nr:hypothetical protein [Candidatus Gastranaerophilales bacterium]